MIGIPTLAASDPQLGGAAAGIGFAIPSSTVTNIASQIIKNGHVVNSGRPYLGIRVGDTGSGVYVSTVSAGTPADKAGLKVGDVITAIDGKPTPSADDIGTVLAALQARADGDAEGDPPGRHDRSDQGHARAVPGQPDARATRGPDPGVSDESGMPSGPLPRYASRKVANAFWSKSLQIATWPIPK